MDENHLQGSLSLRPTTHLLSTDKRYSETSEQAVKPFAGFAKGKCTACLAGRLTPLALWWKRQGSPNKSLYKKVTTDLTSLTTKKLTKLYKTILENLIVPHLVKKFHSFYVNKRPQMDHISRQSTKSTHSHSIGWRHFNGILYSTPMFPKWYPPPWVLHTYLSHLARFYNVNNIICRLRNRSISLCVTAVLCHPQHIANETQNK